MMKGRVFLVNVGVNAAHRLRSPLFADGTFEFVPIPEQPWFRGPSILTYAELRQWNRPDEPLSALLPLRYARREVHNDPEFDTWTYGDIPSSRAGNLRHVRAGDFLFFLARLTRHEKGAWLPDARFCLIGYFEVEEVFFQLGRPPMRVERRIAHNAHARRAVARGGDYAGCSIFAGSRGSRRFRRALPVEPSWALNLLRDAAGQRWHQGDRTWLQTVGSYTRSVRCILDPERRGDRRRYDRFWRLVSGHT